MMGDHFGKTLLHLAKTPSDVTRLLEHGADPRDMDIYGKAVLHYVEDPAIARILLATNRAVVLDHLLMTPLFTSNIGVSRAILEHDPSLIEVPDIMRKTAIFYAPTVEKLNLLLRYGADPNARDKDQMTPLCYASTPDHVQALVRGGANINLRCIKGKTALFFATPETIPTFAKLGADMNIRDSLGRKAIYYASGPSITSLMENGLFPDQLITRSA